VGHELPKWCGPNHCARAPDAHLRVSNLDVDRDDLMAVGEENAGWRSTGKVFCAYLISTGVARFGIEFIRINPKSFLGMSNAQTASLVSILLGIILVVRIKSNKQKGNATV